MATSGASKGRLWLRGWCLRTRSLREQINTAAPCTWTFLPLCRLVPSPFLSVFISRLPPPSSPLSFSSPFPFSDPYHALPPLRVTRNSASFLPTRIPRAFHQYLLARSTYIHTHPFSLSLSFSSRLPLRSPDTHPRFHPGVHDNCRRFLLFPLHLERGIFSPCSFLKFTHLVALFATCLRDIVSWH